MIGLAESLDGHLFSRANGAWASPPLDHPMTALSLAGDHGAVWVLLLGAIAVLGGSPGRKMALAGLAALATGLVASDLLKELFARPRPFLALEEARLLVDSPRSWAFPSGHATGSFAAASGVVLSARRLLGRVPSWGWGMLALAVGISYSRLYVGVHWPSDVAAGVALGAACGWAGARLALRGRGRRAPVAAGDPAGDPAATPADAGGVEYPPGR